MDHQSVEPCPSANELAEVLSGSLPPERLDRLVAHVDQCPQCQQRVEDLEAPDPLTNQLSNLRSFVPESISQAYTDLFNTSATGSQGDPLELPHEIGPYRLVRTMAIGGMGTVYEARHRRLGRSFAFKLLSAGAKMSRAKAERVRREWRAHGSLVHPNIVSATDAGVSNGRPYLVTERIEGADLSRLIVKMGPLPASDASELIRQAAMGVQYAHEQGVIHRDIKPSNLMLDKMGTVKVLDLGTASWRHEADGVDADPGIHGTLAYMAPERFHGHCDEKSDIYSLGCTFYSLLTGSPPFGRMRDLSKQDLIEAHCSHTPQPIQDLFPTTQFLPQLQPTLDKMLAKDPDHRQSDLCELIDQLETLCEHNDVASLAQKIQLDVSDEPAEVHGSYGLTSLLTMPDNRARWIIPVACCLLLIGATWFAVSHRRGDATSIARTAAADSDAGRLDVEDIGSAQPVEPRVPKMSGGEDILHSANLVWDSAPRVGSIDGLVLQPAKFASCDSWQIETIAPRGRSRCVRWSQDGNQLAVVSTDGHIRVYDWKNGKLKLKQLITHRDYRFENVDFHPSESWVLTNTPDKLLQIDLVTGKIRKEVAFADTRELQFVPPLGLLCVSSKTGLFFVDPDVLSVSRTRLKDDIRHFTWSPSGKKLAFSIKDVLRIREVIEGEDGKPAVALRSLAMKELEHDPLQIVWSPSDTQIAVLSRRGVTMLSTNKLKTSLSFATSGGLTSIDYGNTDEHFVVGDGRGIQWLDSTKIKHHTHRHQVYARSIVAWNPRGDCIAVGQNGLIRVVDDKMVPLDSIGDQKSVRDVRQFGPDRFGVLTASGKVVCADQDGRIKSWATLLPNGNQTADRFQDSVKLGHLAITIVSPFSGPFDFPAPALISTEATENSIVTKARPRVRTGFQQNGKGVVWLCKDDTENWEKILVDNRTIKDAKLSPNKDLIAIMTYGYRLVIYSISQQTIVTEKVIPQQPLQNVLYWHDNQTVIMAGAANVERIMIGRYTVDGDKAHWVIEEPHGCTAAEIVRLDDERFLQAGAIYHVRRSSDGSIVDSTDVEELCGRRHGRVVRAKESDIAFSWGFDYSPSYFSNSSDGIVCWDIPSMQPRWIMVDVAEEEMLTLSPAGEVISKTPKATDELIWIVEKKGKRQLHSYASFKKFAK